NGGAADGEGAGAEGGAEDAAQGGCSSSVGTGAAGSGNGIRGIGDLRGDDIRDLDTLSSGGAGVGDSQNVSEVVTLSGGLWRGGLGNADTGLGGRSDHNICAGRVVGAIRILRRGARHIIHVGRIGDRGACGRASIDFDDKREIYRSARQDGLTRVQSAGKRSRKTDGDGIAGPACGRSESLGKRGVCWNGVGKSDTGDGAICNGGRPVVRDRLGIGNVVALSDRVGRSGGRDGEVGLARGGDDEAGRGGVVGVV